jgi:hypothetical protein
MKGVRINNRWTRDDRHTMCDLEDRRINFELLLRPSDLPDELGLRQAGARGRLGELCSLRGRRKPQERIAR